MAFHAPSFPRLVFSNVLRSVFFSLQIVILMCCYVAQAGVEFKFGFKDLPQ
jgi:hypothetical protein